MTSHDTSSTTPNTTPNPGPLTATGRRSGVAIGITGGLLAGTAAGLVFGVPGLTSAASTDVAVSQAALVQQVDETDTEAPVADRPEMGERLRETLQPLVDDGTISAEQADAVTEQLVENRPDRGEMREGRQGRRGGPGSFAGGVASEALTDLLGIDAEQLHTRLHAGETLAGIAEAQGVDVQAVVDELVAELDERLDNAVENGRLDQSEADQKLTDAEARITDMVNNGRPERGAPDAED